MKRRQQYKSPGTTAGMIVWFSSLIILRLRRDKDYNFVWTGRKNEYVISGKGILYKYIKSNKRVHNEKCWSVKLLWKSDIFLQHFSCRNINVNFKSFKLIDIAIHVHLIHFEILDANCVRICIHYFKWIMIYLSSWKISEFFSEHWILEIECNQYMDQTWQLMIKQFFSRR